MPSSNKRPPNAGRRGRKPGTPNVVTAGTREMFKAFVEGNSGKVQGLFDRVARKNPAKALEILTRFSEFVLPRLHRTELSATITPEPLAAVDFRSLDPIEAARRYQELMGQPAGTQFRSSPVTTLAAPAPAAAVRAPALPGPIVLPPQPEPIAAAPVSDPSPEVPEKVPTAPAPAPMALDPNDPSIVAVVNKEDEILRWQRAPWVVT
jgi:hypothetical protein